jgi:hypothetical protein
MAVSVPSLERGTSDGGAHETTLHVSGNVKLD